MRIAGLGDLRKEFPEKRLFPTRKAETRQAINSIQYFCLTEIVLQVLFLNHT